MLKRVEGHDVASESLRANNTISHGLGRDAPGAIVSLVVVGRALAAGMSNRGA